MALQVKMNGKAENVDMNWAGKGVLATCTGERFIRQLCASFVDSM